LESLREDKYTLVYNSYKDKNYIEILTILKPIIDEVYIIDVNEDRIESKENMREALAELGYIYDNFVGIEKEKKYLVFGSFSVVEAFLKGYIG
jgi:dihydrofolate synthase/folylpolyglutamate synthase